MARRRDPQLPPRTEGELLRDVVRVATLCGWLCMHQRPARTKEGWRTALAGHAGFPDLVLAKAGRVIFAELKGDRKQPTRAQRAWLWELAGLPALAPAHEVYVWRPENWSEIVNILSGGAACG